MTQGFAATPPPNPPYFAVIFSSRRTGDDEGYEEAAQQMLALAAQQPGFLGAESARDAQGFGITVSYWDSEAAIAAWKVQVDHQQARAAGRSRWYAHYEVRIARVERAYRGPASARPNPMNDEDEEPAG